MNLQNFASSSQVTQVAMFLSGLIPEWLGDRLLWLLSGLVARTKPTPFRIVRANLKQVLGPCASPQAPDRTARQAIYTLLHGSYELYRAMRLAPEERGTSVEFPETSREVMDSLGKKERGSVLVFPHLGNPDLGGQAAAAHIRDIQVITLPDPPGGFQLANELRRKSGALVTPLSPAALRQAIRLLKQGGVVSIAGDRPVSDLDDPFLFFGSPAHVPSGHVRLALRTDSIVVVAYCVFSPETHHYTMYFDPPLEMVRTGNHAEEIQINMRRVLDSLEAVIRRWPEQWQMFVPVWPKLLEA